LHREFEATLSTNPNTPDNRSAKSNKTNTNKKNNISPATSPMNFAKDKSYLYKGPKKK
jgi:hypothetical protein